MTLRDDFSSSRAMQTPTLLLAGVSCHDGERAPPFLGPVARAHGRAAFARRLLPHAPDCLLNPCGCGAGQTNSEVWRYSPMRADHTNSSPLEGYAVLIGAVQTNSAPEALTSGDSDFPAVHASEKPFWAASPTLLRASSFHTTKLPFCPPVSARSNSGTTAIRSGRTTGQ